MSIAPGARLGSYGVIASIGAGGMGEVFRARDTTLNRDVALKFLPDAREHEATLFPITLLLNWRSGRKE